MARNDRRFFIIRAQAKRAETTIVVGGRTVAITDGNAHFAEAVRRRDAETAYEAAAMRRAA